MATSPAPDAAAPPGMCPGIAVLGGGGGDGDGDGDGSGGGGGGGGGGKGNGKDGKGGGKNGAGCGAGAGAGKGACPNPQHGGKGGGGTAAGDPIDVVTGRVYTLAVTDMALPGAFPLVIERAYSSAQRDLDYDLGHGWNHSLGWRIIELRRDRVRVVTDDALACEGPRPPVGEIVKLPVGRLQRTEDGYLLMADDGITRAFAYATARDNVFRLSGLSDRNGNQIKLFYDGGTGPLQLVNDSVGRMLRVRRHPGGRIAAFEVKNASSRGAWTSFRTYEYDDHGDLVAARDALGYAVTFTYDDRHRLLEQRSPTGMAVHYRYDLQDRCVETWCTDPHEDALLAPDVTKVLADGSRAKGFLHAKVEYGPEESNVITSRSLRRVAGNAFGTADRVVFAGQVHDNVFDDAGTLVGYTDGLGRTWKMGEIEGAYRVENPLGERTDYVLDGGRNVVVTRGPDGEEAHHTRDRHGNLTGLADGLGPVARFRYDERGCLVYGETADGGKTTMTYDALCNRVEIVEPTGGTRKLRYDFLGRLVEMRDENGGVHTWTYDAMGREVERCSPLGARTTTIYDATGRFAGERNADGRWYRLVYAGLHEVTAVERSDGTRVAYAYDRELDMMRIVNEEGDVHTIQRDLEGRILSERTFDGRLLQYQNDEAGRLAKITFDDGESVELAYDDLDRLVGRAFSDGTFHQLSYDARGRVTLLETEAVRTRYTYDARGRCTREDTELRASPEATSSILYTYDAGMFRVRTSVLGAWSVASRRDHAGSCSALTVGETDGDGRPLATLAYDARGSETARRFAGKGELVQARDGHGSVLRAAVVGEGALVTRPGEPEWIGRQGDAETLRLEYQWSPGGQLLALSDRDRGRQRFAYDARGRVAQKLSEERADREDYVLSPRGDVRAIGGRAQSHLAGGRLVTSAGATLSYDTRGRVVRKTEGTDQTTYTWSVLGLLTEVTLPDRTRLEFVYDGFARRLEKRVVRPHEVERHRYRWDADKLLEETVERRRTDGAADAPFTLAERRRYAYTPHASTPLAQATDTEAGPGAWKYFVHRDGAPVPLALVDADGAVAEVFETEAYGRVIAGDATATWSRFPGHWYDRETGLHYNRWRYFDPKSATYLSPEPLGLLGGLESYGYVAGQPLVSFDPDGLAKKEPSQTTLDGSSATGESSKATPADLHPAVAAALPNASARGGDISPSSCSEPAALSKHLDDWEAANPPNKCDPGTPEGRQNLSKALTPIKGIGSTKGGTPLAACPNCSQTISRLFAMADPPVPMPTVADGQVSSVNATNVPGGLQNPEGPRTIPAKGDTPERNLPASALAQKQDDPAMAAANQQAYQDAGGTGSVADLKPGVFDNSSGTWKPRP